MIRKVLLIAALVGASASLPTRGYAFHGSHGGVGYVNAMMKGDDIVLQSFTLAQETRQRTKKVKGPEGTFRDVTETYSVFVPRSVQQKVAADKVRAFDHEGKSVDAQTLEGRLEKFTPVLVSHNARPVDPAYFTMLKKGALVLVLPKVQYSAPKASAGSKEIVQISFGDDDELPPPKKNAAGPAGMPPSLASASVDAKGMIHIQESSGGTEPMDMDIEVENDGVKEKVKITVKNTYFSMNKRSLEAKWVKAHDVSGKDIDAKALTTKLNKHMNVLVSVDSKKVDPYYLQLYKEGTIVLMPPSFGYYGGGTVLAPPIGVPPKNDDDDLPPPKKDPQPKVKTPAPIEKFPPPPKEVPKKLPKQEKLAAKDMPEGSGPVFAAVMEIGPGELTFLMTRNVPVEKNRTKEVTDDDGEKKTVVEKYVVWECDCFPGKFTRDKGKILNTRGEVVPVEEAWTQLQKGTVVLIAYPGQKLGPAYLAALRPGTLILAPAELPLPSVVPAAPVPKPAPKKIVPSTE